MSSPHHMHFVRHERGKDGKPSRFFFYTKFFFFACRRDCIPLSPNAHTHAHTTHKKTKGPLRPRHDDVVLIFPKPHVGLLLLLGGSHRRPRRPGLFRAGPAVAARPGRRRSLPEPVAVEAQRRRHAVHDAQVEPDQLFDLGGDLEQRGCFGDQG